MLSKVSHTKKENLLFCLYEMFGLGKLIKKENKLKVTRACGEGSSGRYSLVVKKFLFGMIKFLEIVVMTAQHCECT